MLPFFLDIIYIIPRFCTPCVHLVQNAEKSLIFRYYSTFFYTVVYISGKFKDGTFQSLTDTKIPIPHLMLYAFRKGDLLDLVKLIESFVFLYYTTKPTKSPVILNFYTQKP